MSRDSFGAATIFALIVAVGADAVADAQGWIHKDSVVGGLMDPTPVSAAAGRDRSNAAMPMIQPRMDFEQWTPLGRGDPLKNDPTFDYLPPVLDKVHYWKTSTAVSRARPPQPSSSAASAALYNRRFFLTDFSRKELVPAYAPYKRPAVAASSTPLLQQTVAPVRSGYLPPPSTPPRPKTPLPMLTPPPYRWPAPGTVTTVLPVDVPTLVQLLQHQQHQQHQHHHAEGAAAGDSAAESKRPPDVRAPPPPPPQSHPAAAVIKTLLDAEVDRTTVTTPAGPATTDAASTPAAFAHYRRPSTQAAVTDRPPPPQMYLIIQGHSKVRKYGLHAAKSDDALQLSAAAQPSSSAQDHNHVGHDGPDRGEPSRRRKRDGRPSAAPALRR